MLKALAVAGAVLGALAALPAAAQDTAQIEWKTFHSPALEGNLEGNPAERGAFVITPPGYDENPGKRYPVVYFLHGYFGTPQNYQETMKFDEAVTEAAAAGNELIMVVPDGNSKMKGGFYSSGPTVGDYESFIARDLVAWVDASYRTIPERASRGLSGHSMGGSGTIRVAMKHPEVYSSIYMMSACCLQPMVLDVATAQRIEGMSEEQVAGADFGGLAPISTLVTWSPDPADEGFLKADTGLRADGTLDPLVNYRIAANSPTVLIPQYLPALNSFEAFAMDIGDQDFLMEPNTQFRAELDRFGVEYQFELYEGDHGNRIPERIRAELLPFFGEHLGKASQ
jgi:enterochelin esterase-like enzyme